MTADPARLLSENGGADAIERELLESVRDVGPEPRHRHLVWTALAAQVTAVSVATAAQASGASGLKAGAASFLSKTLVTKLLLGLAVGGSVIGAGAAYLGERELTTAVVPAAPRPADAATRPTAPEPPPEHASLAEPCENEQCIPTFPGTELPPRRAATSSKTDLLAEESALLMEARAELRSGDLRGAQATLDRLRQKYPRGVLGQEREVLSIELLSVRGDEETARRKARSFVAAHPNSPHSPKLQRFLEQ
jgi:hypothetical protein